MADHWHVPENLNADSPGLPPWVVCRYCSEPLEGDAALPVQIQPTEELLEALREAWEGRGGGYFAMPYARELDILDVINGHLAGP